MSARKLFAIIKYDLKALFSGAAFLLPLTPVFVALLLGSSSLGNIMKSGSIAPFSVALIFEDDMRVGVVMGAALKSIPLVSEVIETDEEDALRLLELGEAAAVVKIPDGLVDALIYNTRAEIEFWGSPEHSAESSLVFGLVEGIGKSVTSAQTTVYAFYDAARPYYESEADFYRAYEGFARDVLFDALQRGRFVQGSESEYDYVSQLVSVILFVSAAFGAALVAMNGAEQYSVGSFDRIKLSGAGGAVYTLAKVCETALFCVLTVAPLFAVSGVLGIFEGAPFVGIFVSALLSSYTLLAIFQAMARRLKNPRWTVVGSFAVALALLFIGGGVYPLYLMGGALSAVGSHTPFNACLGTVIWAFGGRFPAEALVFAVGATALLFLPAGKAGKTC